VQLEPGMPATGALNIAASLRDRVIRHFVLCIAVRANQTHFQSLARRVAVGVVATMPRNSKALCPALVQRLILVRLKAQPFRCMFRAEKSKMRRCCL
jgi:hypothetical protein